MYYTRIVRLTGCYALRDIDHENLESQELQIPPMALFSNIYVTLACFVWERLDVGFIHYVRTMIHITASHRTEVHKIGVGGTNNSNKEQRGDTM